MFKVIQEVSGMTRSGGALSANIFVNDKRLARARRVERFSTSGSARMALGLGLWNHFVLPKSQVLSLLISFPHCKSCCYVMHDITLADSEMICPCCTCARLATSLGMRHGTIRLTTYLSSCSPDSNNVSLDFPLFF